MVAHCPEMGGGVAVKCKRKKETEEIKQVNEFNENEDVDSSEWKRLQKRGREKKKEKRVSCWQLTAARASMPKVSD